MSENKNHIDNLIQQKLKGHHVKAPANAWSRLSADLHKPARTRFFWISRSAAAAVLLMIAFGAGYYFSELNRNAEPALADNSSSSQSELATEDQSGMSENPADKPKVNQPDEKISRPVETEMQVSANDQQIQKGRGPAQIQPENREPLIAEADFEETLIKEDKTQEATSGENPVIDESLNTPETSEEDIAWRKTETTKVTESEMDQLPKDEVPVMTDEMLRGMLLTGEDNLADDILNVEDNLGNSKWIIGGRVSPVYSYRSLSGGDFSTPDESVDAGYFDSSEEGITTIAGGISLDYQFNDRLSLGSGMYLSRIGQQNNDVLAFNDPESVDMFKLATSTGTVTVNPVNFESVIAQQSASPKDSIPGDYIVNGSFVQNLDYLEVPLVLKYKVIDSKLSVNVMGGLSPGILVNNRSYFSSEGEKLQTGTTENINPFIYNSIVGLGLEYAVSKKVAISMEPSFKYALSPVNSGSDLQYHPYSLSWFTGISYKLD